VAELTKKQQFFVKQYLVDQNATRAAKAAGYAEGSADVAGSRLLGNAKVSSEIAKATEKRCKKLDITADRVLQELARLAFYDPRNFFNDNGSLKQVRELDDDTAMALAGMEVNELFAGRGEDREMTGYAKKFKLADKGQNLERLGRHLKLFTDKVENVDAQGKPITPIKVILIGSKGEARV
jgi:phage terminase small subunit